MRWLWVPLSFSVPKHIFPKDCVSIPLDFICFIFCHNRTLLDCSFLHIDLLFRRFFPLVPFLNLNLCSTKQYWGQLCVLLRNFVVPHWRTRDNCLPLARVQQLRILIQVNFWIGTGNSWSYSTQLIDTSLSFLRLKGAFAWAKQNEIIFTARFVGFNLQTAQQNGFIERYWHNPGLFQTPAV